MSCRSAFGAALLLLFSIGALQGCLPPVVGTEGLNHKSCVGAGGAGVAKNAIVFKITSAGEMPGVISGRINSSLAFDECQITPTALFNVKREDLHHATLTVFADPGTKVGDEYFDARDLPVDGQGMTYSLYGREYCSDDEVVFQNDSVNLTWIPEYESGTDCPATSYTSFIE